MNWADVFTDIKKWMEASNVMRQKHPITTDEYWDWLVQTLGYLGDKHGNHPIVLGFLTVLIKTQEESYKQIVGGC